METSNDVIITSPASLNKVVNVSSIPQRSPFRYPGGKTWLIPLIRKWLRHLSKSPTTFVEPFAGGGVVGLTVSFENLADEVILVELDPDVASVWETILNGEGLELAERILRFKLTPSSVTTVLSSKPGSNLERAFQTILRNRVQHGGILAPGASLMKEGENGKGLSSRWYPETLHRRVLEIFKIRDRIRFFQGDDLAFITELKAKENCVFFVDPPYTVTGRRLYRYFDLDHERLFSTLSTGCCEFLMTYDKSNEIRALAKTHNLDCEEILMQGRLNSKKTELIIGRDLACVRLPEIVALPFA